MLLYAWFPLLILASVANFAAYTFAPPILVTPLGALSVIIGCVCVVSVCPHWANVLCLGRSAILASFLLNEELGHIGRVGCTLCLLGSLIIVLHAPEDKDIQTVDEILHYAVQPGTPFAPSKSSQIKITRGLLSSTQVSSCTASQRWFSV